MTERTQKLISLIKSYYNSSDPAHDWAHVKRVASTAIVLSQSMNVRTELVLASVYCHDIVNLPKDHPDRKLASSLAAKEARPHLLEAGFEDKEIEIIQQAIVQHSFSKGLKPTSEEAAILQDADRLDALGAIGILRCAAVNTQMSGTFYEPTDPMAKERELDDKSYMIDHYFVKLFKLPELMNTPRGKELAVERVNFMKTFLNELIKEISY